MLMDGEYAFMPSSALPNILMAHLGIYKPDTDELRLLEFIDLTPPDPVTEDDEE